MDLHWLVFIFFLVLFCFFGLDAKAEEQSADHIEKLIACFSMFLKFLPNMSKINWKKNKLMEVHERSAHAYSATPLDIIQVCMCFLKLFSVWVPSQKVT